MHKRMSLVIHRLIIIVKLLLCKLFQTISMKPNSDNSSLDSTTNKSVNCWQMYMYMTERDMLPKVVQNASCLTYAKYKITGRCKQQVKGNLTGITLRFLVLIGNSWQKHKDMYYYRYRICVSKQRSFTEIQLPDA